MIKEIEKVNVIEGLKAGCHAEFIEARRGGESGHNYDHVYDTRHTSFEYLPMTDVNLCTGVMLSLSKHSARVIGGKLLSHPRNPTTHSSTGLRMTPPFVNSPKDFFLISTPRMTARWCVAATVSMLIFCFVTSNLQAQITNPWRTGIITDEFIYDKAPYPECHAATIVQTKKGLVAAWFGGTKERNPDVCIWVSRKVNGKWTEGVNVANGIQNDTLRYPCWNPVLYQIPNGELMLFYKIGPKPATWKGFVKTSKDGGITWREQKALPNGFIGPVKNKPVLLKNGTLISPSSKEEKGWIAHFELSKDNGKTWTMSTVPNGETQGAIQPSVLFHKDGRLQALCRSRDRAIVESWSADNGLTWSPLAKTSLPNNNSGTDAVALKDGRQLLVYNHVLPAGTLAKGARTPLNVAVSNDGKTWYAALILEDSPISQYSYPAVIQTSDGMVHFVYTWRRERIKHVVVDPSKLKLVEIKNGEWPAVKGLHLAGDQRTGNR